MTDKATLRAQIAAVREKYTAATDAATKLKYKNEYADLTAKYNRVVAGAASGPSAAAPARVVVVNKPDPKAAAKTTAAAAAAAAAKKTDKAAAAAAAPKVNGKKPVPAPAAAATVAVNGKKKTPAPAPAVAKPKASAAVVVSAAGKKSKAKPTIEEYSQEDLEASDAETLSVTSEKDKEEDAVDPDEEDVALKEEGADFVNFDEAEEAEEKRIHEEAHKKRVLVYMKKREKQGHAAATKFLATLSPDHARAVIKAVQAADLAAAGISDDTEEAAAAAAEKEAEDSQDEDEDDDYVPDAAAEEAEKDIPDEAAVVADDDEDAEEEEANDSDDVPPAPEVNKKKQQPPKAKKESVTPPVTKAPAPAPAAAAVATKKKGATVAAAAAVVVDGKKKPRKSEAAESVKTAAKKLAAAAKKNPLMEVDDAIMPLDDDDDDDESPAAKEEKEEEPEPVVEKAVGGKKAASNKKSKKRARDEEPTAAAADDEEATVTNEEDSSSKPAATAAAAAAAPAKKSRVKKVYADDDMGSIKLLGDWPRAFSCKSKWGGLVDKMPRMVPLASINNPKATKEISDWFDGVVGHESVVHLDVDNTFSHLPSCFRKLFTEASSDKYKLLPMSKNVHIQASLYVSDGKRVELPIHCTEKDGKITESLFFPLIQSHNRGRVTLCHKVPKGNIGNLLRSSVEDKTVGITSTTQLYRLPSAAKTQYLYSLSVFDRQNKLSDPEQKAGLPVTTVHMADEKNDNDWLEMSKAAFDACVANFRFIVFTWRTGGSKSAATEPAKKKAKLANGKAAATTSSSSAASNSKSRKPAVDDDDEEEQAEEDDDDGDADEQQQQHEEDDDGGEDAKATKDIELDDGPTSMQVDLTEQHQGQVQSRITESMRLSQHPIDFEPGDMLIDELPSSPVSRGFDDGQAVPLDDTDVAATATTASATATATATTTTASSSSASSDAPAADTASVASEEKLSAESQTCVNAFRDKERSKVVMELARKGEVPYATVCGVVDEGKAPVDESRRSLIVADFKKALTVVGWPESANARTVRWSQTHNLLIVTPTDRSRLMFFMISPALAAKVLTPDEMDLFKNPIAQASVTIKPKISLHEERVVIVKVTREDKVELAAAAEVFHDSKFFILAQNQDVGNAKTTRAAFVFASDVQIRVAPDFVSSVSGAVDTLKKEIGKIISLVRLENCKSRSALVDKGVLEISDERANNRHTICMSPEMAAFVLSEEEFKSTVATPPLASARMSSPSDTVVHLKLRGVTLEYSNAIKSILRKAKCLVLEKISPLRD